MGIIRNRAHSRLTELFNDSSIPVLDTHNKKYAIISDLHLGDGGKADDFHSNENCLRAALKYYLENDFILILLGDIEEFWQFNLDEIIERYDNSIYSVIREFQKKSTSTNGKRIYRIFGNHDIDWKYPHDPVYNSSENGGAIEALKMKDRDGKVSIFLVHGHQGTTDSDRDLASSRFWVKLFRKFEPTAAAAGIYDNPSLPQSEITKDYEKIYYEWAKNNKVIIVCGHTHRAIFASKSYICRMKEDIEKWQLQIKNNRNNKSLISENLKNINKLSAKMHYEILRRGDIDLSDGKKLLPCYFNTGCGLYREGITTMEIQDDTISLIKWNKKTCIREDPPLGARSLSVCVEEVRNS